jgi:DNA polymerase elongation subunit (family B)
MAGMKIPLIAESYVDVRTNKQKLEIWRNGERLIVDPPFLPYAISKIPIPFVEGEYAPENIIGYPLSTLKKTEMFKYNFPNTGAIAALNRLLERDENKAIKHMVCDNHTEFRERIIIDEPDYFDGYANTNELVVFGWDIETLRFDHRNYPGICSMAWGTSPDKIKSIQLKIHWNEKGEPYVDKEEEKAMLEEFTLAFIKANPDIVIGYNHKDFDFVVYGERCAIYGIDITRLARGNGTVKFIPKKIDFMESTDVKITGRVVYDILESARGDQSLHGIKRRGMKDVAEWMKIPTIREDTDNTAIIPLDKMKKYNESDVYTTFRLFKVYFLNNQTLAEMYHVPLNMILDGSPSFLANVFQAPALHKMGIVSDGMNRDRHPEIYDEIARANMQAEDDDDEDEDEEDEEEAKKNKKKKSVYEAAYVDIFQTGIFEKVFKVDYKGMYNAIEITGNISPETTKIIKYLPYDKNGYKKENKGNLIIYYVPDKRIKKTVVIAVNNSFDGVLKRQLKDIRETRFAIKQQLKTCAEDEIPKLESQQYGLKVVANIPSGYNGQSSSRWGDIAVSILTVGIGRLLICDTIRYIEAKYGGNDWILQEDDLRKVDKKRFKVCIEVDTDGIYINKHIDVEDLNEYLTIRVKELLGVEENEMQLDFEEYNQGIFLKMKTYVLYDEKDNLIIHGGALKGSRQARCFDKSLEKLIKCLLKGEGKPKDVINEILDIKKYEMHDLALGVKLSKDPDTYDVGTVWGQLIKKARALGIPVKAGSELDYVKVRGDEYEFLHLIKSHREINIRYYENMISKLIINFGLKAELKARNTEDLDEWFDTGDSEAVAQPITSSSTTAKNPYDW